MDVTAQIYQLASTQGGVITRTQAIEAGLTERQIDRRVQTGQWGRCFPGAYQLFVPDDPMAVVRAAVAVLPGAIASHHSAAKLHGVDRVPGGVPSVLVHTQTTHAYPGVRVFRAHDVLDHHRVLVNGVPTTSVARTLVDLASVLLMRELGVAIDSAVSLALTDVESIQSVFDEVARRGKPGVRKLRALLDERSGGDRSASILERRGVRVLTDAGLTEFETEYPIPWSRDHRFDVAFVHHKLAVEWDSRRWHSIQQAFESDRRRDRMAILHGWRVLRFTWADVNDRPSVIVETVRQIINQGAYFGL